MNCLCCSGVKVDSHAQKLKFLPLKFVWIYTIALSKASAPHRPIVLANSSIVLPSLLWYHQSVLGVKSASKAFLFCSCTVSRFIVPVSALVVSLFSAVNKAFISSCLFHHLLSHVAISSTVATLADGVPVALFGKLTGTSIRVVESVFVLHGVAVSSFHPLSIPNSVHIVANIVTAIAPLLRISLSGESPKSSCLTFCGSFHNMVSIKFCVSIFSVLSVFGYMIVLGISLSIYKIKIFFLKKEI
ncbi:MAG: hypothetical protein K6E76_00490 [Patescibacteria group bacterium]|nr:hypothetical protein [Patescibacteria group bacterium]